MKNKAYRDAYVSAHISNTIAAQISMMRQDRGLTQSELARLAGMKQSRISALEDPNYENFEATTLKRIASALDIGLIVRFSPFSEIVEWSANFSDSKLKVPSYEQDGVGISKTESTSYLTTILFDNTNPINTTTAAEGGRQIADRKSVNPLHYTLLEKANLPAVSSGALPVKMFELSNVAIS